MARADLRRGRVVHGDVALAVARDDRDVVRRPELVHDRARGLLALRFELHQRRDLCAVLGGADDKRARAEQRDRGRVQRHRGDVDRDVGLGRERDDVQLRDRRGIGDDVRDAAVIARDHVIDEAGRRGQLRELGRADQGRLGLLRIAARGATGDGDGDGDTQAHHRETSDHAARCHAGGALASLS